MKLGENLREMESEEGLVGMRNSTNEISRRGTKTNSMTPRHLWILSEKDSCCRFLFKVFSIWTCCCASKSSAADGDRYRICPFPPPGFSDCVSCTGSSSSYLLVFPSNWVVIWFNQFSAEILSCRTLLPYIISAEIYHVSYGSTALWTAQEQNICLSSTLSEHTFVKTPICCLSYSSRQKNHHRTRYWSPTPDPPDPIWIWTHWLLAVLQPTKKSITERQLSNETRNPPLRSEIQ